MKKYTTLALIGAIVAGVAGLISIDAISATSLVTMQGASDFHESGLMIGHVTYEVRGADGQIKQYIQGDNFITRTGTDCAAAAIFDSTNIACPALGNFEFIAIGNGTGAAEKFDTVLNNTGVNTGEIDRKGPLSVDIVKDTTGTGTVVTISNSGDAFTFLDLKTTVSPTPATTITQSGLFDAAAGGNMFAIKDLVPTVGVANVDTLTVTWKITLTSGP